MNKPEWLTEIEKEWSNKLSVVRESAPGDWELTCSAENFRSLLVALKSLKTPFEHLADLTAYDDHPRSPRFAVVYELISMTLGKRCRVVVFAKDDSSPRLTSVIDLWPGANWLERETYDMFGIIFEGHPDLRRILLPPSFNGFPLRKDFVVDYRQDFSNDKNESIFDPFGNTVLGEGHQ